jgi:hypothetical protein
MCKCRLYLSVALVLTCGVALSAAGPQIPQNHGIALSAGCEATTCIGDSLLCSVDVTRNDACGDAIAVLDAHAHIGPEDPNAPAIELHILSVVGNTTAVVGPFAPFVLGSPGDTFDGLPGDMTEPVVTLGFVPGDYIVQPTDPDPSLITFHIEWEDQCNDFNHTPDCTDCPADIQFEATTGAVFHPSPIPNCCIAGPALVCPGPHAETYTVTECSDPPLTDVTFAWTISGDALFCDGSDTATGDTVCVDAFLVCPGSFTLDVTVTTGDGCTNTCSYTVEINDTTPPVLTGCPDDASFQCNADVPPPADVTAEDDCDGPVDVVFTEDQTNPGSNCDNIITRTWTATDFCGNEASCTQIITVNDTTPPELFGCPTGGTLDCNVPLEFTVTEEDNCLPDASAVPVCTAVIDPPDAATFEDLGGGSYRLTFTADGTATITCSVLDACGNEATCTNTFDATCAVGCTLTWGYWKTHGIPDCGDSANPHPDDTWLLLPGGLGTDTIFYLSDQTYCEVMLTAPKGNPYYSLAHQFIAAQLNQLAGASIPSDVLDAYNEALMLFETYTPDDVKNSFDLKAQFNALVGILDDYNSGLIGPGHCGDEAASATLTSTAQPATKDGAAATIDNPQACGPAGLLAPLASALGLVGLRRRR